jgi:predicted ATPase/class 3 adenylate cyclase
VPELGSRRAWRDHVRVPELPSGTVTLLFTDIEGSTRLLEELGDGYADMLEEHRRLLREAFARHNGVEVDTQGDAFFVAFARATDAVAAAADGQSALESGPVRVRIGIHTGEPTLTDGRYVGIDVHKAARIMSAGHGGQVVISEATRQLLDSADTLDDLGHHRLKDLGAPQRLYQLCGREFPPLKTLHRTNLPIQATPLVGRERELEEAGTLLRANRLVTLTGPGGSGKTRLALQLAAEAQEDFPDGTFWVSLQAVRDPAVVERAIAAAIGADDGLTAHVDRKRLLLLLDNFEQIVEAAPTVSSLLAETPNAKVIVTSREPLHVDSEQRYPVEPLAASDAVTLFIERAQSVDPAFVPHPAVEAICSRLDGLPLAIELAAARVALLGPGELLERLEHRLPLLTSRSRGAPERQRTLRATIEWSYDLLEPPEKDLFRKLGVFRGSFSLDSAEVVCGCDLDLVESLVLKSLVRRWDGGRLGMLDTIREYAAETLDGSEDAEEVHRAHAEHFLRLVEDANMSAPRLDISKPSRFDVVIAEQDNIRAALAWAVLGGNTTLGLKIAAAAEWFWVLTDPEEGMRWFSRLYEQPDAAVVPVEIRADSIRAWGSAADIAGHVEEAGRRYEESLALYEELKDEFGCAVLLHRLSLHAMRKGDLERARELVGASHEIRERHDDTWGLTQTVGTLGAIERDAGDPERARELIAESAALASKINTGWWEGGMLAELAQLDLAAGRIDEGKAAALNALALADEIRDRPGRVFGVGLLARAAVESGDSKRAGLLWGAIEDEDAGAPLGGWRRHREATEERMRELAGPDFERALAEGRELTLDEAVELARS